MTAGRLAQGRHTPVSGQAGVGAWVFDFKSRPFSIYICCHSISAFDFWLPVLDYDDFFFFLVRKFSRRPRVENALLPARSDFTRFLTAVCVEMTNDRALCCRWNFHTRHCCCCSSGHDPAYLHTGCHPKSPRPGDFRDVMRTRSGPWKVRCECASCSAQT